MSVMLSQPIISLSEAQAFVRIETGEEEAVLAGLIRTSSAICETFLNQVVIARSFQERLTGTGCWQVLASTPVRSIDSIVARDGEPALQISKYHVDVDGAGTGWLLLPIGVQATATGMAGMAADRNGVPEPIRQGVIRLVSYLYTVRDSLSDDPPASVTALWRPYRRLVLA